MIVTGLFLSADNNTELFKHRLCFSTHTTQPSFSIKLSHELPTPSNKSPSGALRLKEGISLLLGFWPNYPFIFENKEIYTFQFLNFTCAYRRRWLMWVSREDINNNLMKWDSWLIWCYHTPGGSKRSQLAEQKAVSAQLSFNGTK